MAVTYHHDNLVHGGIQNLSTADLRYFLINPTEIEAALQVAYAQKQAIASSRQRLQYRGTSNVTTPLTLVYNRAVFLSRKRQGQKFSEGDYKKLQMEFMYNSNFLAALCYPEGDQVDPIRRAPPAALLVWPSVMAMKFVVRSLRIKYTRFDYRLWPIEFTASLQIEEFRTYRLTSAMAAGSWLFDMDTQAGKDMQNL